MAIQLEKEYGVTERVSLFAYRILAIIWILKGFLGACELLGIPIPGWGSHVLGDGRATVYSALFAGLDIIAGVSLWLSFGWGAVIWLSVSIFYSLTVLVFAPGWHSMLSAMIVILMVLLHAIYRLTLRKDAFIEKLKRA